MQTENVRKFFGVFALVAITVLSAIRYEQTAYLPLHGAADPVSAKTELVVLPDRAALQPAWNSGGFSISTRRPALSPGVPSVSVRQPCVHNTGGSPALTAGLSVPPCPVNLPSPMLGRIGAPDPSGPAASPARRIMAVRQRQHMWHQSSDDDPHPAF